MATPGRRGLEALLDVTVFAPLGLAVSFAEALPKMAAKGRARVVPQVGLARTVGQFAVDQACRRAARVAGEGAWVPRRLFARWPNGWGGPAAEPATGKTSGAGSSRDPLGQQSAGATTRAATEHSAARRPGPSAGAEMAASLAIPSYDSLSAPQVVQRLDGLSREEIEAVRRYEASTRGRRTILARAEQLLS